MPVPLLIALAAVFTTGALAGVFVMLLIGSHTEERHATLTGPSRTRTGTATRRLLSVYVRRDTPAQAPGNVPDTDTDGR